MKFVDWKILESVGFRIKEADETIILKRRLFWKSYKLILFILLFTFIPIHFIYADENGLALLGTLFWAYLITRFLIPLCNKVVIGAQSFVISDLNITYEKLGIQDTELNMIHIKKFRLLNPDQGAQICIQAKTNNGKNQTIIATNRNFPNSQDILQKVTNQLNQELHDTKKS